MFVVTKKILIHKTFEELTERGKYSMGWFFGFKLHLIINDKAWQKARKGKNPNTTDAAALMEMIRQKDKSENHNPIRQINNL